MTISFLLSPWFFHKKCAQRRINDLRSYHEYGNPPVAMQKKFDIRQHHVRLMYQEA